MSNTAEERLIELLVESADSNERGALATFLQEHPELEEIAKDYEQVLARMDTLRAEAPEMRSLADGVMDAIEFGEELLSSPPGPFRARAVFWESTALIAGIGLLVFQAQQGGGLSSQLPASSPSCGTTIYFLPLIALGIFSALTLLFGVNGLRNKRPVLWVCSGVCLLFAALAGMMAFTGTPCAGV